MMMIGSTFMENRDHLFTLPTARRPATAGWVEGGGREFTLTAGVQYLKTHPNSAFQLKIQPKSNRVVECKNHKISTIDPKTMTRLYYHASEASYICSLLIVNYDFFRKRSSLCPFHSFWVQNKYLTIIMHWKRRSSMNFFSQNSFRVASLFFDL